MENRILFYGLIVLGVIIILASIFAHSLGLGSAGFGVKKILGFIVGVIVLLVGLLGATRTSPGRVR